QGAERPAGAAGSPPLLPLVAIGPARRRRRARGSMLTAPGLNERRYCPAADSRSLISDLFIPWRAGAARSQTITGNKAAANQSPLLRLCYEESHSKRTSTRRQLDCAKT